MKGGLTDFTSSSLLFWNLLIFIVFQSIFFYFISSAFLFEVLDSKISAIGKFAINGLSKTELEVLKTSLVQNVEEIKDQAEKDEAKRAIENKEFLIERIKNDWLRWVGILFVLSGIGLVVSGSSNWYNVGLMSIVVFAYLTEVWLFFFMMKPYEYIGTYEIIKYINDKIDPSLPEYNVDDIVDLANNVNV